MPRKTSSPRAFRRREEDGVGYALDDNNKSLITDEMKAAVEKAKADIISGAVKVLHVG